MTRYEEAVPLASYPSDENISPKVYAQCMDTKYVTMIPGFVRASEAFGISADADTIERWKRMAVACGELDNLLDESRDHQEAEQLFQSGISYLRGDADMPQDPAWTHTKLKPTAELLCNSVAGLPEERRNLLLDAASLIGSISLLKAEVVNARLYCKLLRDEGMLSGLLITESVSEEVYSHDDFDLFSDWTITVMEAGTLADSTIDLRRDYAEGLTRVKPTMFNHLRVAQAAMISAKGLLSAKNLQAALAGQKANKAWRLERAGLASVFEF